MHCDVPCPPAQYYDGASCNGKKFLIVLQIVLIFVIIALMELPVLFALLIIFTKEVPAVKTAQQHFIKIQQLVCANHVLMLIALKAQLVPRNATNATLLKNII